MTDFTERVRSKVTLHIYHPNGSVEKNNHIQKSRLSIKSVHERESKSYYINNI